MARRHLRAVPDVPRRAVCYVRVSALMGRGGDSFHSPDVQLNAMRRSIAVHGLREVAVVDDIDVSGTSFSRDGIDRVRRMADEGKLDVLLVYDVSRFGRDVLESLLFLRELSDRGVTVISATEGIDTSTDFGRSMLINMLNIAEIRAREISRAWRATIAKRVSDGLPGTGRYRFGYRNPGGGRFEPDPELGEVLAEMYRRYLQGEGYKGVARWLNDHGHRTTAGGIWREETVRSVLDSGFGAGKLRHHGELVDGLHDPVITPGEWERYLRLREERCLIPSRAKGSRYVLTTLVKCGVCGAAMNARPDRNGVHWYRCRNRNLSGCLNPRAKVAEVEREVLSWLRSQVEDIDNLTEVKRRSQDASLVQRNRAEVLERQIRQQDEALKRLTIDRAHGRVPDNAYDAARDEIVAVRDRLVAEHEDATRRDRAAGRVDLGEYRGLLAEWDELPVQARRDTLRRIVARVRVWGSPCRVRPVPIWEDDDEPRTSDPPASVFAPTRSGLARFTAEQARAIRERYRAGESISGLAREYGASSSTVYMLVKGRTYRGI